MTTGEPKPTGLALLRVPFEAHQISKLPKGTKAQNECAYTDKKHCEICGGFHHPKIIHLDYVGHAALTDRLLDADPNWNWEPVAIKADGSPALDDDGGMWIRLTVCGVTRLGYGDAQGKSGANAVKERIGDALRNAAMRFGAALDLWHKGDLHGEDEEKPIPASSKAVTTDAWDSMSADEQKFLQGIADAVLGEYLDGGHYAEAVAYIDSKHLDPEEKTALWSRFSSQHRAAMKSAIKAVKKVA